jgi:beta-phosphoglucomutase
VVIKALFFDFDGVFVESLPYHLAAWDEVLMSQCRFHVDPMTVKLNEGRPVVEIARAIFEQAEQPFKEELLHQIIDLKNECFRATHRARVFPENLRIIALLKKRGIFVGLVTGTKRANLGVIVPQEIMQLFDVIIADGDTPLGKPAPDPYLAAAERLKVQPAECLVVENAPLGIQSAKTAGMFCVALTTTLAEEHLQQADVTFQNHRGLYNKLVQNSLAATVEWEK